MKDGKPVVDAVVNLTGFSLVGGPAYNDTAAAEAMLTKLDRPYIAAHPVEFQTLQAWGANGQGLLPLEATMMIAIPELDGGTQPMVFGGRSDGSHEPCTGCNRGCTFPFDGCSPPDGKLRRTGRVARRPGHQDDRVAQGPPRLSAGLRSCCSTSRPTPVQQARPSSLRCSNRSTPRSLGSDRKATTSRSLRRSMTCASRFWAAMLRAMAPKPMSTRG